jgi:hypothetical protein
MDRNLKTKSCDTSGGPSPKRRKLGVGMKRQVNTSPDAEPPRKKVRLLDNFNNDDDDEDNDILVIDIDIETIIELENLLHSLNI